MVDHATGYPPTLDEGVFGKSLCRISRGIKKPRSVAELYFFWVHSTQPTKLRDPVFISAFAIHFPSISHGISRKCRGIYQMTRKLPTPPRCSLAFRALPLSLGGFGGFSDFRWENRTSQSMFDDTGGG